MATIMGRRGAGGKRRDRGAACVLRYKRHHSMASGIHAQSIAAEFLMIGKPERAKVGRAKPVAKRKKGR